MGLGGYAGAPRGLAAKRNRLELKDAPEEMKGDRELCMAAVAQDGFALEHASPEMKSDIAIVRSAFHKIESRWLAAVKQKYSERPLRR